MLLETKADREMRKIKSNILELKSRGFTLIEITITIVIVGVFAGISAMIIMQGIRAYSEEKSPQ